MKRILLLVAAIIVSAALYAQDYTTHTVKQGESLWRLAQTYGVSVQSILDANKNIDPRTNKINIGQRIRIPSKNQSASSQKKAEAPKPIEINQAAKPQQTQPEQIQQAEIQQINVQQINVQQVDVQQVDVPETEVQPQEQTEEVQQEAPKTWWEKIKEAAAKRRQEEQLRRQQQQQETEPAKPQEIVIEVQQDTVAQAPIEVEPQIKMDSIKIALLLPFNAKAAPAPAPFHFYAGALLAADEMGRRNDIAIKLNVFDTTEGYTDSTDVVLRTSDVILGPMSPDELRKVAPRLPEDKFAVSVLDPAAASLADSISIIQAPTIWNEQIKNLARWASEDMQRSDSLLVIKEAKTNNTRYEVITDKLDADGMPYVIITCDSFEDVPEFFEQCASKKGCTRFIIASEREDFIRELLTVIADMRNKDYKVASYATSRVRSFTTITSEMREKAGLRMVSGYYIDEGSQKVKDFREAYQKQFGSDPDSFAFQGYDLMNYFVAIYQKYKEDWIYYLPDFLGEGLQTDFRFTRTDCGFVNTAVRRFK